MSTLLSEDEIVEQLTKSMKKSDMGATTPADVVSRQMRDKWTQDVYGVMDIKKETSNPFEP